MLPRTLLSVIPPPKRRSTPQSVARSMSFQRTSLSAASTSTALRATSVSNDFVIPKNTESLPLKSHPQMANRKMNSVRIRLLLNVNLSVVTSKCGTFPGRARRRSNTKSVGRSTSTQGIPIANHSVKLIFNWAAAIALGGVPIRVPMPPMLAE